jgi:predicted nucleic acid-binding protein
MAGLTLDTGALIALERRDRRMTVNVDTAKGRGVRVTVPTAVVVEWWRGQRGPAARLLEGLDVEPLSSMLAHIAGAALAAVGDGPSAVDAVVMASAAQRGDVVYTADLDDLEHLREHFPGVRLLRV